MAKKKKSKNDFSGYVKWLWIMVGLGVLGIFLSVGLAAVGAFGELPSIEVLENPKSKLASEIITSDGQILGKFYQENRTHTEYEDLSPHLVNALVATEDERYYRHSGVDFKALIRAVVNMGRDGGGSTITQQLAKQLFHKPARTIPERIKQKFKEWVIATKLERLYTKEEIIAMYFNQFDFLYQAVGISSGGKNIFQYHPRQPQPGGSRHPGRYGQKSRPVQPHARYCANETEAQYGVCPDAAQ
ncbi:MAG: biosynthetic peptidoglycan transglycosylase [Owenweeksia sp.]|nr:biosynthetic peptidoglycan transglycosylase [Owenweeksia sp.]